jgi:hypothetical protein
MSFVCVVAGLPGPVEPQRWESPRWPPRVIPSPIPEPERKDPAREPAPTEDPEKVPA